MSDGKTHFEYYKKGAKVLPVITIITALFWFVTGMNEKLYEVLEVLILSCPLYIFGRWVDPDLDQMGISSAEGRMTKDFGPLGYVFIMWWMLYAIIMSGFAKAFKMSKGYMGAHRTEITHSYPGTVIRTIWTLMPMFPAIPLFSVAEIWIFVKVSIGLFIALAWSDTIHYALDGVGIWKRL